MQTPDALDAAKEPAKKRWFGARLAVSLSLRGRELAVWLRGALLLAITGFSVAGLLVSLFGRFSLVEFFSSNRGVGKPVRLLLLVYLAAGAGVGISIAVVSLASGGRCGATRTLRRARLLSPLLVPGLAVPILFAKQWDQLPRIAGVAVLTFIAELCVRGCAGEVISGRLRAARWLARIRWSRPRWRLSTVIVLLGVVFYAAWMSVYTILQHRQFGTMAFDLGSYDTTFYNALHGHPFRSTAVLREGKDWSMLSNHAEFSMYALLPFYALRPGPETLLILQAVALASGAIPVYRFAGRRLPRPAACILAGAYLLYAPMQQANFYDVHFQPFAVAFTLWALDLLDTKNLVGFAVLLALALGCREDVPIGFAVVGVYLLLTGRRTVAGTIMLVVSVTYFVVVKFAVMPRFGSWWFSDLYKDLYPPGENSYGGVVKTLLTNPVYTWKTLVTTEKMVFFLLVLTPIAFLPLRRGFLWMSLLPGAMFTLLTTGYEPTVDISFQYVCLYVPFIFLASALALGAAAAQSRARLCGALGGVVVATVLVSRIWGAMPPGDRFKGGFREIKEFRATSAADREKARDIRDLLGKVPPQAKVAVSELEHPHASTRLNAFALRLGVEGADYILYDEDSGGYGGDNAREALQKGEFEVVERRPRSRMALLRRRSPAKR